MTLEEFIALIEESNEYVLKKFEESKNQEAPKFETIEEFMEYYDAIPFEEFENKIREKYGI